MIVRLFDIQNGKVVPTEHCYTIKFLKDKLDIAGFSVGEIIYDLPKKELMNEDCILYGIPSSGIHSNGYTLVRELLETSFYPINEILEPTRIYIELLDL